MIRTSAGIQRLPFLILTFLLHLPLLTAQVLRAQPLLPTLAPLPLFVRQVATCDIGQIACHDGSGGCCDIGALCTVNTNLVPICQKPCAIGAPQCTGILSGLCCSIGYTCNYQSTICISHGLNFVPAPITDSDDDSGPASVTALSIAEAVTSTTTSISVTALAVPSPVAPIVPIVPATPVQEPSPVPRPVAPILPATSVQEPSPSSSTSSTTSATSTTAASSATSGEPSTPTTPTSQSSAVEPITTAQPSVSILTVAVAGGQRRLPFGVERLLVSCVLILLLVL